MLGHQDRAGPPRDRTDLGADTRRALRVNGVWEGAMSHTGAVQLEVAWAFQRGTCAPNTDIWAPGSPGAPSAARDPLLLSKRL